MPAELALEPEYCPGLYDSANGRSLVAEKVIDITDDCPSKERTILLFTRAERGRIVQIAHPYDGEKYMGSQIHFFVDELNEPVPARDDTFQMTADRAGMTRSDFQQLICSLAP